MKKRKRHRRWTDEDEKTLRMLLSDATPIESIADKLNRSIAAVNQKLIRMKEEVPSGFGDIRKGKRPYVSQMVYRMRCEENKKYVGASDELERRIGQHFIAAIAPECQPPVKWLEKYKPVALEYFRPGGLDEELKLTLESMQEFGWENVRGSFIHKVQMTKPHKLFVKYQEEQALLKAKLAPASEQGSQLA